MAWEPGYGYSQIWVNHQEWLDCLVKFEGEILSCFGFGVNCGLCGSQVICKEGNVSDVGVELDELIGFGYANRECCHFSVEGLSMST